MQNKPYSLLSIGFVRSYWTTLRPYLFFLSGVSGLVGLALAENLRWSLFVPCFLAFFFSYGLGQALTDVFQTDTDSISSPYRPLTQGLISKAQVFGVSVTGLVLCGLVLAVSNPWTLVPSALGIIGLATYTPFKRRWWAGPPWNSWIVALLPAIGYLAGGLSITEIFADSRLWAVMLSMFFSYAIFVLLGYHKDISADRQTGYNTIPVRFGWSASVVISLGFGVAATVASVLVLAQTTVPQVSLVQWRLVVALGLWCLGVFELFGSHLIMLRINDETQAHRSIAFVVRGYTLFHLGEAVALKPDLALFALVYYGLFEMVLAMRPEKSQI